MKVRRVKRATKTLNFYKYNYKIVPPWRVLVDGTFCLAALRNQINLREQVGKYLDGETMLMTTNCVLKELEVIGSAVYGALVICQQFEVAGCPHKPCRSAADCLAHLARKMGRDGVKYIFGTQDDTLRDKLRSYPGVPHLFIMYNTIQLDKVSEVSKEAVSPENVEINEVRLLKESLLGNKPVKKKPRGPKGVNPLSCKKKKKPAAATDLHQKDSNSLAVEKKKRRRKKASSKNTVEA